MIDRFKTNLQASEFLREQLHNSSNDRYVAATYAGTNRSYDIGLQWLSQQMTAVGRAKISREVTDFSGLNGPIRATVNRITKFDRQVKAATNPSRLFVDALPPAWANSLDDADLADLVETVANITIDEIGLLETARRANFERVVAGDHGIGLTIEKTPKGDRLRAYDFDYSQLILDPANHLTDLSLHEHVIIEDVWTVHKVERVLGKEVMRGIDVEQLSTVGAIMPVQMHFATLTGGALYGEYRRFSTTRGMRVWQTWVRGPSGRFDWMYFSIDPNQAEVITTNIDNPENPFAGSGMPLVLLRGHERPRSRRSISDTAMMRDDQDRSNLVASLFYQQMYNQTSRFKWLVDRGWFGGHGSDDTQIMKSLEQNIVLTTRPALDRSQPPKLQVMPPADQNLPLEVERSENSMRQAVFRAEIAQGGLKTHQTNRGLQLSIEQTELPLDDRINSDVFEYQRFIAVATGTMIELAPNSEALKDALKRHGIDTEDLARLSTIKPDRLPADLRIRDQSIRFRSRQTRKQELFDAAATGAIDDPVLIRQVMARELDMPLTDLDKKAVRFARASVRRIVLGEEWVPLPLGDHARTLIDELRSALMDRETYKIEGAAERVIEAINSQTEQMLQEIAQAQGALEPPPVEEPQEAGAFDSTSFQELIGAAGGPFQQALAS